MNHLAQQCVSIFPDFDSPEKGIPAACIYATIALNSPIYALEDDFGKALRFTLCGNLADEEFLKTGLGPLTHVALALRQSICIRCDESKNITPKGLIWHDAVLDFLCPRDLPTVWGDGKWAVGFSCPGYILVSYTGTLFDIAQIIKFKK